MEASRLLDLVADWRGFLDSGIAEPNLKAMRRHERTGRPLGNDAFLGRHEESLDRVLRSLKRARSLARRRIKYGVPGTPPSQHANPDPSKRGGFVIVKPGGR